MTEPNQSILVRALTTDPPEVSLADVPHLLAGNLAGEVRARLPKGHPLHAALRAEHMSLGVRHAAIRAELRPLLAAWAKEGIPALLFKGFALAEFEYGTPGERFYGDVDVLIPDHPLIVIRAVHIALAHGWRNDGQHASPEHWSHESAHLFSPGHHVRLDVHRFALGWVPGDPLLPVQHVTRAVWERAQRVSWEGIPVWRPDPVDALVVNVALARQWGGDVGHLKAADYSDARVLAQRHALTETELAARARELGGLQTWRAFRSVCDPERRSFALNRPVGPQLRAAAQQDGHHKSAVLRWAKRQWRIWLRRLQKVPWVMRVLPDVLAAWVAVRRGGDPRRHLARWTPSSSRAFPTQRTVLEVIVTVRWLTRLLYPRQSKVGTCVPRAYATYRALRRLGYPAVYVSGVARTGAGIVGHAWVEDIHTPLEEYGESNNRRRYKEVFSYPT